jgi:hypothetical protein
LGLAARLAGLAARLAEPVARLAERLLRPAEPLPLLLLLPLVLLRVAAVLSLGWLKCQMLIEPSLSPHTSMLPLSDQLQQVTAARQVMTSTRRSCAWRRGDKSQTATSPSTLQQGRQVR